MAKKAYDVTTRVGPAAYRAAVTPAPLEPDRHVPRKLVNRGTRHRFIGTSCYRMCYIANDNLNLDKRKAIIYHQAD